MYSFISKQTHRGLKIWLDKETPVQFLNAGTHGYFETKDSTIAEKLRKNHEFGIVFNEITKSKLGKLEDIKDGQMAETVTETVRDNVEPVLQVDVQKFIRFGELKGLLIKPDGQIKKTAPKELIDEYNNLKTQLGA